MKKIILFGANGYIGRNIAYFLKENNIQFLPTDISDISVDNYSNYQKIDVTNINDLQQLDFNVDYVFAFAGLTGSETSLKTNEKFTKVNENGLANVIECCKRVKGVRIVFPSTRLVYKGVKNFPLKEDAEKEAKTVYAKNKLVCEGLLTASNIDYTIFRICVPYGNLIGDEYSYGTIGFFIGKALKGEDIPIYGDGSLKRTFTHVEDITRTIFRAIELDSTVNNVYNIGSNDALSLLEVAKLVANKYNVKVKFVEWTDKALKVESGDTIFDDSELQKKINHQYNHVFSEWVKKDI